MGYIQQAPAAGKSEEDTPASRDILLASLRTAVARAKLEISVLEDLGIRLRQRALSCAGVREQLRKEGLLDRLGGVR
jgi:hypothetical protein